MNRRNFLKTIGLTAAVPIVANIKVEPINTGSELVKNTNNYNYPIRGNSWTKQAISEAKNNSIFSKLGEKMPMPKCNSDTIVKYNDMPILDSRNIIKNEIEEYGFHMEYKKTLLAS